MKKNHALMMALSALSAGLLISCAKPADESGTSQDAIDASAPKDSSTPDAPATDRAGSTAPTPVITPVEISADSRAAYLTHVADEVIVPAYDDAAAASQTLHDMATTHCQSAPVSGDALAKLRAQWVTLAQAWAAAEVVNFGPATDSMSNLYINYYPDTRGLVHNGVADLIAANPNLTADKLQGESAIVQGVPGLEEALFANDSLDAAQCAYVISASSALATRLDDIKASWQNDGAELLSINKDNDQGLNRWFNSVLSLVETMKSVGLDQPLGLTGSAKGHLPAATAGKSRDIINAKLAELNTILTDPVLTAMLNSSGESEIGNKLSGKLADTSALLAQMPEDIKDASAADQQALYDHLTTVTRLIKRELIPTLGIRVGFNSTDGD